MQLSSLTFITGNAAKAEAPVPDKQTTLAAGYIQKLRETGDGGYLDRASKILDA